MKNPKASGDSALSRFAFWLVKPIAGKPIAIVVFVPYWYVFLPLLYFSTKIPVIGPSIGERFGICD